ncbi:MAG: zinc ribbon domain-containing protein [Candidatus Fimisoma sp.]
MAFWDNLGQKASDTTAKAMQKAKEMADIAKLNSMISEEETKINNSYYQVGKLYVTMHLHDHEEEFAGMISSLAKAEEKIKNYRQQIQDIKGVQRCEKCGAEVANGAAFCSSCGATMPKIQTPVVTDVVKCQNCGTEVKKGMRFCTSCGKPMETISVAPVAQEATVEATQEKVCFNCGAKVEDGVAFCTECGAKL